MLGAGSVLNLTRGTNFCGLGTASSYGLRGLQAWGAGQAIGNGVMKAADGDYLGALLDMAEAGAGLYKTFKPCFTSRTRLLTPDGDKRISRFRKGDAILAKDEFDPKGPVVVSYVEEVFEGLGRILHIHVGKQVIQTTPEHLIFEKNAWKFIPAGELRVGDQFLSDDGQWVKVTDLLDTGIYQPVYNVRVAEHHTYFVGSREWGFSVWAHNTCVYTSTDPITGKVNYVGITDNPAARTAAHARAGLGVRPVSVPGLGSLSRADARAVEQVLIENFGLGKSGGSLLNKINSIASTNSIYTSATSTGASILHSLGLFGF